MRRFPRGFESWSKAHYHSVQYINHCLKYDIDETSIINKTMKEKGIKGLYELAVEWATFFEFQHSDCDVKDEHSFAVRNFCELQNYPT